METAKSNPQGNVTEAKVMAFDDLCAADRISVQTKKSKYQFSVLDPSMRKGTLTGGFLGDQICEAVLLGAVSDDETDFVTSGLKTGLRAVFILETKTRVDRLITSVITDITHIVGSVDATVLYPRA
jgi:hypothetical protein